MSNMNCSIYIIVCQLYIMYFAVSVNLLCVIQMSETGVAWLRQVELSLALEQFKLYIIIAI
jgi:hypothetical protein